MSDDMKWRLELEAIARKARAPVRAPEADFSAHTRLRQSVEVACLLYQSLARSAEKHGDDSEAMWRECFHEATEALRIDAEEGHAP